MAMKPTAPEPAALQRERKTAGQLLFEVCMSERLLNDIRGWDARDGTEEYGGSTWQTRTSGLPADAKAKWERAASRLGL